MLLVDHTVLFVLTQALVQLVKLVSLKLLIISVFAQPRTSLMLRAIVFLVLQAAKLVHQVPTVLNALILSFFKDQSVRPTVTMVSPPSDQFVWDAPRDVFSALKTSFASTVLMDSICTMVTAMIFAQLELLEIALEPIGTVFHATHHVRLA